MVRHVTEVGLRINGGFFVMNQRFFDYIEPGEDILGPPSHRMAAVGQLGSYDYGGFWACMDTFKEKTMLEDIYNEGHAPWEVWGAHRAMGDGVAPGASSAPPVLGDGADQRPVLRKV